MHAIFCLASLRALISHIVFWLQCRTPGRLILSAAIRGQAGTKRYYQGFVRRLDRQLAALVSIDIVFLLGAALVFMPTLTTAQDQTLKANSPSPSTVVSNVDDSGNDSSTASSSGGDSNTNAANGNPKTSAASDDPTLDSPVVSTASSPTLTGNFWQRLGQAYMADWKGTAESGPEPKYRGFPPPVTNPPFPFTVWPYGGSVTIGYPWTQSGPLMEAIWSGADGEKWKKTGIQIYGWINGGFNVSSSTNGHYANAPAAYFIVPNSSQPDQQTLYIERQPDTVQTDHFDWGFRITNLYGIDYRFTTAKGWFSSQLLGHTNSDGSVGSEYGYDMVMAYVDLYFPHVAQGLNVRIGRYISLPDIEA